MTIRKATEKDAINISNLINNITNKNPNNYSKKQIEAWKKYNTPSEIKRQLDNRIIFCAFENGKLIGTIALKENFILGFYVNYINRKTGIGTKLLHYLEEYALSKKINSLKLTATPSALEFYISRGYTTKEKVVLTIFDVNFQEVKMEKVLV